MEKMLQEKNIMIWAGYHDLTFIMLNYVSSFIQIPWIKKELHPLRD